MAGDLRSLCFGFGAMPFASRRFASVPVTVTVTPTLAYHFFRIGRERNVEVEPPLLGYMLIGNAVGAWDALFPGNEGDVLVMRNGVPTWEAPS